MKEKNVCVKKNKKKRRVVIVYIERNKWIVPCVILFFVSLYTEVIEVLWKEIEPKAVVVSFLQLCITF